jgi:two-component system alkaline phosphatase synthesis response regulator PhoP
MSLSTRLLVFDPEQKTSRDLLSKLNGLEFRVRLCEQYEVLPRMVREFAPQTLIFSLKARDEGSLFLVHEMTRLQSICRFSILVVLEKESEYTEIKAYEAGADSVIVAPIRGRSLKHRIWALNRRADLTQELRTITIGSLTIDAEQHAFRLDGQEHPLGKREFDLLYMLAQVPGKIYSRFEILERVVGVDTLQNPRTVDVHVCNLRDKLPPKAIMTFRGKGYYLNRAALESTKAAFSLLAASGIHTGAMQEAVFLG